MTTAGIWHGKNGQKKVGTDEYPISRYWREVKFEEILGGTSEVQRLNITTKVLKV